MYDMNSCIKELHVREKLGAYLPDEDELYTKEMASVFEILKKVTLPKQIKATYIALRDESERFKEALHCFDLFKNPTLQEEFLPYLQEINIDKSLRYQQNKIVYMETQDYQIVREVSVPAGINSQTSITLAKTLVSLLKSCNPEEFYNSFETGETLPIFMEEIFSSYLGNSKENEDLLVLTQMTRMWGNCTLESMYKQCMIEKSMERAKAYHIMTLNVYPCMKGYIDALKLLKVYQQYPQEVLQAVERVLWGLDTTENILCQLGVADIQSEEIIEERCKKLKWL